MIWSMVWAGVTAWLSAIVMCFTVGPNWETYLEATSSYVVSSGNNLWPPESADCILGLVHGCIGFDIWWRHMVCRHDDGFERE